MSDALGIGRWTLADWPAVMTRSWVQQLADGREVPEYGSREWFSADRSLQIASALIAAEAYRRHWLFLPQALADELDAERALLDEQDARAFADLAGRIVSFDYLARRAASLAKLESHEEMQKRRAS